MMEQRIDGSSSHLATRPDGVEADDAHDTGHGGWAGSLFELLRDRIGLALPTSAAAQRSTISRAMLACRDSGFTDPLRYLAMLSRLPLESEPMQRLIARITIKETYFFRDDRLVSALRTRVLPELLQRRSKDRQVRVWCAGCATGEDAYMLAILLAEQGALAPAWDVQVLATDIDMHALAVAREALYGGWSLRACSAELRGRYFEPVGDLHRVRAHYRAAVRVKFDNIIDEVQMAVAPVDLVLFRNVAIYFDDAAVAAAYAKLARHLAPDGWVMKGVVEPPPPGQWIEVPGLAGCTFAMPGDASTAAPSASRAAQEPPDELDICIDIWPGGDPGMDSVRISGCIPDPASGSSRAGERSGAEPRRSEPPAAMLAELLARATALADSGHLSAANGLVRQLLASYPLEWRTYLLAGMMAEELSDLEAARAWLRQVVYLAPDLPIVHLRVAMLEQRAGNLAAAERALLRAHALVRSQPCAADAWASGGYTADELGALIEHQLALVAKDKC